VLLLQGRAAEALAAFERALARAPDNGEARLGRAEALNLAGRAQESLAALEPLLAGPGPDAWLLSALALLQLGLHDDAARCALEARRRRAASELVAPHRADLLRELVALFQSAAPAPLPGARADQAALRESS
jgi:tetratricopeptide (TPR) repeat protein